jgi:hypothetical protein
MCQSRNGLWSDAAWMQAWLKAAVGGWCLEHFVSKLVPCTFVQGVNVCQIRSGFFQYGDLLLLLQQKLCSESITSHLAGRMLVRSGY